MYISSEDIDIIKYFIQFDTEACGIFELTDDDRLSLFLDSISEYKEVVRHSCTVPRDRLGNFYWHTHPYSEKGYPSPEDIIKSLKDKDGKVYFLFSTWGIWTFYSENPISKFNREKIYEKISQYNEELYFTSEKGRFIIDTEEKLRLVVDYSKKLENYLKAFGFKIKFVPWARILPEENYVV